MKWVWKSFEELTKLELYAILRLRQQVFGVEQDCAYQDLDNCDQPSDHFMAFDREDQLVGYARIAPPGVKYPGEHSIGRVVTAKNVRGTGIGKEMMAKTINSFEEKAGKLPIRISAQAYLEKFYSDFGFEKIRGPYEEDGIPHIEMLRKN